MSYYSSLHYQKNCVTKPIFSSVVLGGVFTAFDIVQGAPARAAPRAAMINVGGLYLYHILQCPMEAISGGPSALHNIASGGLIGYMGVRAGALGIPMMDPYFFYRHPSLSPPLAGAAVYGGIAGILATFSGKPL